MTASTMLPAKARAMATSRRFAELSVVTLVRDVDADGDRLPKGAKGTIVHAYADGAGYEVEFDSPFHAVVTLEADDLTA